MTRSLGIKLDPGSHAPLYRQIASQIVARIRTGTLPPGFRLPPTRRLAGELETHRNTVVRAFEELVAGGYVNSVVGRGTFVATASKARTNLPAPPPTAEFPWGSLLSAAAEAEPITRLQRLGRAPRAGADAVSLSRMQPSRDLLPDAQLRRCIEHVLKVYGARALEYAPAQGLTRLRVLISEDLERQGVPAAPEDILVTTGSQQAIDLVARALIDAGDTFLTEGHTYSGAVNALSTAGARIVGVPCDADGPVIDALDALSTAAPKGLYVMPNCRNPTGTTMSRARREALVAWSVRRGIPLLEDDYGADLDLESYPAPPALRALNANVFYVGTYSKKLIPALRVGFLVCPPGLCPRLTALKHAMDLGTSALLQHALAEFLDRGYLRPHLQRVRATYRARRDALVAALRQHLPEEIHFDVPTRGVILWLQLPLGIDAERVVDEAARAGVHVSPSSLYTTRVGATQGLRLIFCNEPPERLRVGAERLGKVLQKFVGHGRDQASLTRGPLMDIV